MYVIANLKVIKDFEDNIYQYEKAKIEASLIKQYKGFDREILKYVFEYQKEELVQEKFIETLINILEEDAPIGELLKNSKMVFEYVDKDNNKFFLKLDNEKLEMEMKKYNISPN